MAKLADATALEAVGSNPVGVQILLPAQNIVSITKRLTCVSRLVIPADFWLEQMAADN